MQQWEDSSRSRLSFCAIAGLRGLPNLLVFAGIGSSEYLHGATAAGSRDLPKLVDHEAWRVVLSGAAREDYWR